MGAEVFPAFPDLVAEADDTLGYSITQLCLGNPDNTLLRTQYAQPALYVVEALTLLAHRRSASESPDYLVGHSVGEFAALFAAGVFDFGTGLRLVMRRGELMADSPPGSMAALLGVDLAEVDELVVRFDLTDLDVALFNAPGQIALAGPHAAVDRLVAAAEQSELKCVRLNTSGPFHSRYMADAATEFGRSLAGVPLAEPKVPVVANATGLPYEHGTIAEGLVRQMTSPVRWYQSLRHLLTLAEQGGDSVEFTELGPGSTLTGMLSRIRREHARLATPA
jgi:trans-AT polyketide synthase/acyltransferase/oxidoreductase domain-containing protein